MIRSVPLGAESRVSRAFFQKLGKMSDFLPILKKTEDRNYGKHREIFKGSIGTVFAPPINDDRQIKERLG